MRPNSSALLSAAAASLLLLTAPLADACTLFGAAGEGVVEEGGVLVAKTRDEHPGPQEVKVLSPRDGHAYFGLFTGAKKRFNMGLNDQGLFLARSTSGGIPKKERLAAPHFYLDGLITTDVIMRRFSSVDEVLAHPEVFVEPVNYLLADRTKVAVVEVLPGGRTTVRITTAGTAAHTNHFIEPESKDLNQIVGASSARRLERIGELLAAAERPITLEAMNAMTRDRHDGPVRSIWRTGVKKDGVQTLAAMTASIPKSGDPEIRLVWRTAPDDPASLKEIAGRIPLGAGFRAAAEKLAAAAREVCDERDATCLCGPEK